MKIYDNGIVREATAEEIAEYEEAKKRSEEESKKQPLSDSEALNILLGGAE